ncbi:cellulose biosynthesis protein BcsG, partial [Escherichia coli]
PPTTPVPTTGGNAAATGAPTGSAPEVGDMPAQTAPPTTANHNAWLNNFYNAEAKRKSSFPSSLHAEAQPYELLVINKCSQS